MDDYNWFNGSSTISEYIFAFEFQGFLKTILITFSFENLDIEWLDTLTFILI